MSDYWISTWGGTGTDYGYSVTTDSSGNIYVAGHTDSTGAGGNDFLLAKYDPSGSLTWQRTLGGTGTDSASSVTTDSSDNIYVTGYTSSTGAGGFDLSLFKYDPTGSIVWQRTLGGTGSDYASSVITDSSGNIYVSGYTNSTGAGGYDFLLAKYDSSGSLTWQRTLGGTGNDFSYSVTTDGSGNIYVAGETSSTGAGGKDLLLAKYDSSGSLIWQRVLGGTGSDVGFSVTTDSSGNIYVFGYTTSTGAGNNDFLLAKYDPSGSIVWQRVLGGTGYDTGRSVTTDSSGNIYVSGYTASTGAGGYDFLLAKYDSSGSLTWQRTLGGTGDDYGQSVTTDSSGNIYVAGFTYSTGAGGYDLLLAKLPSDGSLTGVYGPFTYQASSLTSATSSLTAATSSLTSATSALTSATSSLTELKTVTNTPVVGA